MFRKIEPKQPEIGDCVYVIGQFPHCDPRVLHAPGECEFCDRHHDWQALRMAWGIAFTGWQPDPDKHELPCPANHARGNACEIWAGNKPRKPQES